MSAKPFIVSIDPNGKKAEGGIHSVSPAWVITILRWDNRDTAFQKGNSTKIRRPLVIENDCIRVKVSNSKKSITQSAEMVFKGGDLNYATAIAPGDYVYINMLDNENKAKKVAQKARVSGPINKFKDGLKFVGKITSVRKHLRISEKTGIKILTYTVSAHAFSEFNNKMYFNPTLVDKDSNIIRFLSHLSNEFRSEVGNLGTNTCQKILKAFINLLLGDTIQSTTPASSSTSSDSSATKGEIQIPLRAPKAKARLRQTPNEIFKVPSGYSKLLGLSGSRYINNISILMGIQEYQAKSSKSKKTIGLNPLGTVAGDNLFQELPSDLDGAAVIAPEYWNNVTIWSIFYQYLNYTVNEMYTTLKFDINGRILPTLVMRQIPFTTEHYSKRTKNKVEKFTKFMTLPRWKVNPALIYSLNIGREDAARINFVQVFGLSVRQDNVKAGISAQNALGNYQKDLEDMKRNGLRSIIKTSNHDLDLASGKSAIESTRAPKWATLLADWLFGGHLKLNGQVSCYGIVEPITVGDNFELDDVVYHIEQTDHIGEIKPDGTKTFRTNVALSHGVGINSKPTKPEYAEMDNTFADLERKRDFNKDKLSPGSTDVEDVASRVSGERKTSATGKDQKSFNKNFEKKNLGKD